METPSYSLTIYKSANDKKEKYINLFLKHLGYFEQENPDRKVMLKRYSSLKKFLKMYINNFPGASILRQELMETETPEQAREILSHSTRVARSG